MQNLLQREEKKVVKTLCKTNPLYKKLNAACKDYECDMTVFRISPEDIFVETLAILDRIKEDPDEARAICNTLWDSLYCEYRDATDCEVPIDELSLSVCIVMLAVVICVNTLISPFYTTIETELMNGLNSHYQLWHSVRHKMAYKMNGGSNLKQWVDEYMKSDYFMTDEYGRLFMLAGTESDDKEPSDNNLKKTVNIYTGGGPAIMGGEFNKGVEFNAQKAIASNER